MLIKLPQLRKFIPALKSTADELSEKLASIGHEAEVIDPDELEVKVFPNRGDILSLYGLARDLVGYYDELGPLKNPEFADLPEHQELIKLGVSEKARQYLTADSFLKIENYTPTVSPKEIQEYLSVLGLQPKDLLIDLTNALTYELGLPLHVFDSDSISDGLEVDLSKMDEELVMLNGKTLKLPSGLLIQRSGGKVVDLMGVMGGRDFSVNTKTSKALIQAATFNGKIIRQNSLKTGTTTEASYRNQRGVDPLLAELALSRVAYFLTKYSPKTRIVGYQQTLPVPAEKVIEVSPDHVSRILGVPIAINNLKGLENLGFKYHPPRLSIPTWRQDIALTADVAEEVAKKIGLNAIGESNLAKQAPVKSREYDDELMVKKSLSALGATETMSYSFVPDGELKIQNPRNKDQAAMRPTLKSGLLQTLSRNPYLGKAIFYEIGHVFLPDEQTQLGIIVSGYKEKGLSQLVSSLSEALGTVVTFTEVTAEEREAHSVKQNRVYFAELPVSQLNPAKTSEEMELTLPKFQPISKFPPLLRDVTLSSPTIDEQAITDNYLKYFPELFLVEQIDRYKDPENGRESVTFRLIFQKMESSFTHAEINKIDDLITKHFLQSQ